MSEPVFPGAIKTWTDKVNLVDDAMAEDINEAYAEIIAIEKEVTSHKAEYMTYEGKKLYILNPYKNGGSLSLKGQLHCHSTNSDGSDTPAAIVTAYKNAGYDLITVTDHNFVTPDPGVAGITWLGNSVEESYDRHVVAYDVSAAYTGSKIIQDIINHHSNNGCMVDFAHPLWNYAELPLVEISQYYGLSFIEIYNKIALYPDTPEIATQYWDSLLSKGQKVFAVAVDDCHSSVTPGQFNWGWVVVHCNENTKAAILDALRSGNFYASTGNDISVSLEGNIITATSIAPSNIKFIGRDGRALQTNNGVTSAAYTIKGDEMYVRVESQKVSDSTYAWSQPIFVDCIGDDGKNIAEINRSGYLTEFCKQLILDGNLQITQAVPVQGTEITDPENGAYPVFDTIRCILTPDGGILPTIKHSQALIDPKGIIPGSFYSMKINVSGAGSGFGAGATYGHRHYIDNGVRLLCNNNRKVTLSFWAKSTIPNKRIGVHLIKNYGTGGTPSGSESIIGSTFTLKSYWKRYSITLNLTTIAGKTFGTNNDDSLGVWFQYMWGLTNVVFVGAVTAEDFVGAGDIEFAQIQMNIGEKALPYYPSSYEEELRKCKRVYQRIGGETMQALSSGLLLTTSAFQGPVFFPEMRRIATASTAGAFTVKTAVNTYTVDTIAFAGLSKKSVNVVNAVVNSAPFTAGQAAYLRSEGSPNGEIILDARW